MPLKSLVLTPLLSFLRWNIGFFFPSCFFVFLYCFRILFLPPSDFCLLGLWSIFPPSVRPGAFFFVPDTHNAGD